VTALARAEERAEQVVLVEGLAVRFGDVEAVAGISFDVAAGEAFGLLGPNGAGKTTTIRVLTTLLRPGEGTGSPCASRSGTSRRRSRSTAR
jgi:ABC-type multidrug transport system ATPase subunit